MLRPGTPFEEFEKDFKAPAHCSSLMEYIQKANAALELMQTRENLRLVTLDLFRQLQDDHVIYAEIRFAPLLHLKGGLKAHEVVECVNEAVEEGIQQTGIEARIILATLRHFDEEQSLQTARLVDRFKGTHVVALDIASDEAGYPVDAHLKAFEYAIEHGIHRTAHAGEACGAESVRETLKVFKPSRIGHGVRASEDESLLQYLKDEGIHLEICPTSNIQTGVYTSMQTHTVNTLFQKGLSLGINTDGRTISDVSLEEEYSKLIKTFGWTLKHFEQVNLMAAEAAFCDEKLKRKLIKQVRKAYSSQMNADA
jgi:adenosine deaminase